MAEIAAKDAAKRIQELHYSMKLPALDPEDYLALAFVESLCRKVVAGELREVVHGKWELARESNRCYLVKCTNCGHSVAIAANVPVDEWRAIHRYCVDCGALMDARENSPENDEKAHSDAHSEAAQRKDSSHETD